MSDMSAARPAVSPNSYDEVPYRSHPFRQTHPDRLAVIAALRGLSPVPIERARVLELGCASGGNLIPMADQLPDAKFVGIDGSLRQIEQGHAFLRRTGLTNIELRCADILELQVEAGSFDYILCHGVYSWVPDAVQQRILDICGRGLGPEGVAYVSYNTYPGWHMRGMIREIMRYRANFFESPQQKLSQARGLLTFLSESVRGDSNAYAILLKNELDAVSRADDSYLFHEHLEEVNEPTYFHEFVERARQSGLEYLGEADYGMTTLDSFPPNVRAMLQGVSRDWIETEQYMDFLRNRMFRQTLLCRGDRRVERAPHIAGVLKLHVASNAKPEAEVDVRSAQPVVFRRGGSTLTTSEPVVKAAMLELRDRWPQSIPFLELASIARSRTGSSVSAFQTDHLGPGARQFAETMLNCYATGQVDFSSVRAGFITRVDEKPRTSRVIRAQAEDGSTVTDLRHGGANLDDFQRQLLIRMDGTRSQAELLDDVVNLALGGGLILHHEGRRLNDEPGLRSMIGRWMTPALNSLASMALLVEGPV
jgi:SAM-dependent methyltransferase